MKNILIVVGIIVAIIGCAMVGLRIYTKSFSPESTSTYEEKGHRISVNYCRPYKNGREVFPDLIPYDKVWRTGANEATKITTAKNLLIKGQALPKGSYSLWTIPGKDSWEVIFNKEIGQWGLDPLTGKTNRDETLDALVIDVPVYTMDETIEQFTIQFEEWGEVIQMLIMWDKTLVVIPIDQN